MEKVRQEVKAQRIPGLRLDQATDADLEHLKMRAAGIAYPFTSSFS
jgi:hypothetical protein